jgi:hypothetical protein
MKLVKKCAYLSSAIVWLVALFLLSPRLTAAPVVVFQTGFEISEGYQEGILSGQKGWVAYGTGGNGIVSGFFEGSGQQAYVGFNPPTNIEDLLNVWKPIDYAPLVVGRPIVRFSVHMEIVDSTNGEYDNFRWSAYNTNGARLFSLDFDNYFGTISYGLDDTNGLVETGFNFSNDGGYDLVITMNFAQNRWTAELNDTVVVNAKPITTTGAALNFGDMDAVWAIFNPQAPGDNFMVFDDYRVTADTVTVIPPRLEAVTRLNDGRFLLRVNGEPGVNYVIEASTNLGSWVPLDTRTGPTPGGVFEYLDGTAGDADMRFYRVRHQP